MTKIYSFEVADEAVNKLEEARKNLEAAELIIALLRENLAFTAQENGELRAENDEYRKQLYEENNPFNWE